MEQGYHHPDTLHRRHLGWTPPLIPKVSEGINPCFPPTPSPWVYKNHKLRGIFGLGL